MDKPPANPPELSDIAADTRGVVGVDALKAYLRANPHALDGDGELVSLLTPPAYRRGHNIVDMQSFMIERLRTQAAEREAREARIRQALACDALEERRVHKAVLLVAAARSFESLIETIAGEMAAALGASAVAINIERPDSSLIAAPLAAARPGGPIQLVPTGAIERCLGPDGEAAAGVLGLAAPLFPPGKRPLRSYVAARLSFTAAAPPGLLAIGAKASNRFSQATGLHRYIFLARMIEQSVRLWLDLPPR